MITAAEILAELKPLGRDSYKRVMRKHGVVEPYFGVKIEELKKFQKRIRKNYQLALDLYATGNYDAQYLAGLIADETRMTRRDFQGWLSSAKSAPLSGVVARLAAESPPGWDLALEWIESKNESVADAGWSTLSGLVSFKDDAELDLTKLKQLLLLVGRTIHGQPNGVRYAMNGFVIALGTYVRSLTELALQTAVKIGPVSVDMGDTSCQVPFAPDYIRKIQRRGSLGKKRKAVRC
jgi:3-methyladenine DNA glycosylase AlkD